jgi:hypothetical protein
MDADDAEAQTVTGPPEGRHIILVAGMHRSGTSALTRVLNLCGAALPLGKLLPANDENPDGFWESEPLVHLHDDVLAAWGLEWNSTRELPPAWIDSDVAQTFQDRIYDFIAPTLAENQLLVIKDPRLCLLMPLWRRLAQAHGIALSVVLPMRNPLEVAASLARRDGMPQAQALLLWLRHVLQAERDSRGMDRCFIHYEALLHDGPGVARTLAATLPVRFEGHEDAIAAFVNPERRHHLAVAADLGAVAAAAGWVATAYDWGRRAEQGEHPAPAILDEIHAALHAAEAIFRPILDGYVDRLAALQPQAPVVRAAWPERRAV